jgi:hypothetical protein
MLGDRLQLANNLWLVVGEMPQDNFKHPDIANALVYRSDHEHFQRVLSDIFAAHDGLTVGQIYAYVQQYQDDPVVQKFLALEFPHTPPALQNVIVTSLLQMGYQVRGPRRKKRFYRPARAV